MDHILKVRASEVALWVRVHASQANDLESTPYDPCRVRGESTLVVHPLDFHMAQHK